MRRQFITPAALAMALMLVPGAIGILILRADTPQESTGKTSTTVNRI